MVGKVKKYLGIDVGGGSIKADLIDISGNSFQREDIQTDKNWYNDAFLDHLKQMILRFPLDEFESIGLGTPGPIDIENTVILSSANLSNLSNVPLGEYLGNFFQKKIYFNNDANCAALGEYYFGDNKNIQSLVVITLGTGYGCGWVHNGKIFNGYLGNGMEAGHQTVVLNGALCGCGSYGCVESYFSTKGFLGRYQERTGIALPNARVFFELVEKKDIDAETILSFGIDAFANSLKNIIHMINPDKIVLVGGITKSHNLFFEKTLGILDRIVFPVLRNHVRIEIGRGISGTLGAAALGF